LRRPLDILREEEEEEEEEEDSFPGGRSRGGVRWRIIRERSISPRVYNRAIGRLSRPGLPGPGRAVALCLWRLAFSNGTRAGRRTKGCEGEIESGAGRAGRRQRQRNAPLQKRKRRRMLNDPSTSGQPSATLFSSCFSALYGLADRAARGARR